MSPALQRLLDGRSIEPFPAADDEVTGRWRVAVSAFHDSRRVETTEIRVSVCYQAGLQAAIAIIRAAGYRLRSAPGGHHFVAFATIAALGSPEFARLGDAMNRLRRRRHDAVYDWREPEHDDDLHAGEMERAVDSLLRAGIAFITQIRPAIANDLSGP